MTTFDSFQASRRRARPNTVKRLLAWCAREVRIRRGIAELEMLSRRQLDDIGLAREVVRKAARFGRDATHSRD